MKIRAGKKRAINKLIKLVADDELTTTEIYDRMLQQSSQRTDLTFRQLTNILSSYFDEVGYDYKIKQTIWRNKNEQKQISKEQNNKDAK